MSELRKDLRIGLLGAAVGVFSVSMFLLVARIDSYYEYLAWIEQSSYEDYPRRVEDLWWIPVLLGQASLSVLAALAANHYLGGRLKSSFLLWQIIGVGSLLAWGLMFFVVFTVAGIMNGEMPSIGDIKPSDFGYIAKYVSAVFACHVCYGSLINASAREYGSNRELGGNVEPPLQTFQDFTRNVTPPADLASLRGERG
jgi:hypothetical protein